MTKDLLLGAITKYKYSDIKNWVNSINRSGFTGDRMIIVSDVEDDVKRELKINGFDIIDYDANDNIVVERFIYYWHILNSIRQKYRFVIATDVSDVVFQRNPSEWLEFNLTHKSIVASSESIRYKDEAWGRNNLSVAFGQPIFNSIKDNVINNAGVIAGHHDAVKDLFLNIYLSCGGSPRYVEGGGGPDQAAYNILLSLSHYKNNTYFAQSEEAWAAQCGTTVDPHKIDFYRQFLTEPQPEMHGDIVCNSEGEPFYLVHQYNRVPEWKAIINEKFK
ncbi:hypothetical protein UFOVP245_198 [uncultured Caudovirales phage]|uniref:Uncharacterized protein n=1 Tax=uncultured Caudovirales phage TaxID=2100421 RepID=A0A6J7WXZ1_9CAUD|nr:hypothetical protein UFOVP245_198 [uncultured Caudovirales phage]